MIIFLETANEGIVFGVQRINSHAMAQQATMPTINNRSNDSHEMLVNAAPVVSKNCITDASSLMPQK